MINKKVIKLNGEPISDEHILQCIEEIQRKDLICVIFLHPRTYFNILKLANCDLVTNFNCGWVKDDTTDKEEIWFHGFDKETKTLIDVVVLDMKD